MVTCKIEDCGRIVLARDLCRRHYERSRKWGDPLVVHTGGAHLTIPEELAAAGISTRMRNHWALSGALRIERDGAGRYVWTRQLVAAALLMKRLLDAGIPLAMAGKIAHDAMVGNPRRTATTHPVAPGVAVTIQKGEL